MTELAHGDFTGLAENYSKYRPGYSESVLDMLLAPLARPVGEIELVDVGAGTGIWTRMLAKRGCRSVIAVEPNDAMRAAGIEDGKGLNIQWIKGNAEETGLEADSADMLSMASSFHWADREKALKEFARVLRPGGRFVALWNPRLINANPLTAEIEEKLKEMLPALKRVSSGHSGVTKILTTALWESPHYDDVVYVEGRHTIRQTPEHYQGVWWSVNDIRVQAGEKIFKAFMKYVQDKTHNLDYIETTYQTRAWTARRV